MSAPKKPPAVLCPWCSRGTPELVWTTWSRWIWACRECLSKWSEGEKRESERG